MWSQYKKTPYHDIDSSSFFHVPFILKWILQNKPSMPRKTNRGCQGCQVSRQPPNFAARSSYYGMAWPQWSKQWMWSGHPGHDWVTGETSHGQWLATAPFEVQPALQKEVPNLGIEAFCWTMRKPRVFVSCKSAMFLFLCFFPHHLMLNTFGSCFFIFFQSSLGTVMWF